MSILPDLSLSSFISIPGSSHGCKLNDPNSFELIVEEMNRMCSFKSLCAHWSRGNRSFWKEPQQGITPVMARPGLFYSWGPCPSLCDLSLRQAGMASGGSHLPLTGWQVPEWYSVPEPLPQMIRGICVIKDITSDYSTWVRVWVTSGCS